MMDDQEFKDFQDTVRRLNGYMRSKESMLRYFRNHMHKLVKKNRVIKQENEQLKARVAELEQKIFQENALVMANARRLIKAKVRTSNARLFMELFGTGFGTATSFCRKLGLDPSSNETNYTLMMEHLHQQAKGE